MIDNLGLENRTKGSTRNNENQAQASDCEKNTKSLFLIFSFIYAFYVGIHSLYVYQQGQELWVLSIPLMSLFAMIKPSSVYRFMLITFASFTAIWSAFPSASNSTFLSLILASTIIVSFLSLVIQKRSFCIERTDLYNSFAPAGRFLLITLYLYGVVQKINSGYMNPEFSCATAFMNEFRFLPQWFIEYPFVEYASIYGIFIIEALIAICILFPKTRYWGIVIGGGFHLMLSLNTYNYFHTFTTLSILMHFLYLDPRSLQRLRQSVIGRFFTIKPYRFKLLSLMIVAFICFYVWVYLTGQSIYDPLIRGIGDIIWLPMGLSLWLFAIVYDKLPKDEKPYDFPKKNFYRSPNMVVNAIVILYFLSCLGPYVGLKSEQALNMYSNLRVTYDTSNSHLFPKPINLFSYQKGLVKVLETDNHRLKRSIGRRHVLFARHFFDYLARNPSAHVVYMYNGEIIQHNGATTQQIKQWKLSYFEHKLLSFQTYPENLSNMSCRAMHI